MVYDGSGPITELAIDVPPDDLAAVAWLASRLGLAVDEVNRLGAYVHDPADPAALNGPTVEIGSRGIPARDVGYAYALAIVTMQSGVEPNAAAPALPTPEPADFTSLCAAVAANAVRVLLAGPFGSPLARTDVLADMLGILLADTGMFEGSMGDFTIANAALVLEQLPLLRTAAALLDGPS